MARTTAQGIGDFLLGLGGAPQAALGFQRERREAAEDASEQQSAQARATVIGEIQSRIAKGMEPGAAIADAFKSGGFAQAMDDPDFLASVEQLKTLFTPVKAPETRKVRMGTEEVAQEFDAASGQWREVSRGAAFAPPAQTNVKVENIMPQPMAENIWTKHGMAKVEELDADLVNAQKLMFDFGAARQAIEAGAHQGMDIPALGVATPLGVFGIDVQPEMLSALRFGEWLGITDPARLEQTELLNAITSRLAPLMRPPGSGATSDFEMELYLNAVPNLLRSAPGNLLVIDLFEKAFRHKQRVMRLYVDTLEDGTYDPAEFSKRVEAMGKIFSEDERKTLRLVAAGKPDKPAPKVEPGTAPKGLTEAGINAMQHRDILMLDLSKLTPQQRAWVSNHMSALGM